MDTRLSVQLVLMLLCIVFSGFFSATETAFLALNKTRLHTLANKGSRRAAQTIRLSENYDKLISSILIGNNIVNIATASLGTVLFVRLLGDIGATVSTAVVTVVVLIFGEVAPKTLAKEMPERFAMFATPVMRALVTLCTPVNYLFTRLKQFLISHLHFKQNDRLSQEELLTFVSEAEQGGSIDRAEGDLLKNVISFADLKAEDILTHRTDLEAVSLKDGKPVIAAAFARTKFSRLPVYDGNIDHIVGIIHQKDFYNEKGITSRSIQSIMTQPLYITADTPIDDLMRLLQKSKSHVAVVLDEYGGTLGIVTLEDILEELVGEIWDEHDDVEVLSRKISANEYIIDSRMPLDDFCSQFGITVQSESTLLAGWVMEQMGKVPQAGESFAYENIRITVTKMDGNRIAFVRLVRLTNGSA